TWRELGVRVNKLSNALLAIGLKKGDKLAVVMPNCLEVLETYWATIQIGVVLVPLSPLLRGAALAALLRDSDSVAVVLGYGMMDEIDSVRAELPAIDKDRYLTVGGAPRDGYTDYEVLVSAQTADAPPHVEIGDDDLFNIVYSSGTTGMPKGIIHTHYIRANYCTHFASTWRMTPESVVMHAGSLVFNGAFVTLMPALFLGTTYVLQARFDAAEFIETVAREKVTHVMMVPSQILAVMNAPNFSPAKLASLHMLGSVGAPLHRQHKDRLTAALPGIFHELYGLTEGVITILDKDDVSRKAGSVGGPQPFFELRVAGPDGSELPVGEVGEIVGRSPLLMPGYYKRPDLTADAIRDGWMFTGDMGYLDADGYLYLVDRKKDLIISGGVNVYPKDIEEVVVTHPDVVEAAVFGIPNEKWGEAPMGAVVLRAGAVVDEASLKSWVNERVGARYQQLCGVVIMQEFPRNAAGKTLKRLMRDEYWKEEGVQI
ncbi:MAG: acyl-CoA synthetase (AMP-forming)/AMP-acid ligase, partial [Gemmatimonadetes bacterium]|nr:acyl-CoA synthetase (AMP-forming)/AMP-acid ligase [Gemmatimonadota bacterium]